MTYLEGICAAIASAVLAWKSAAQLTDVKVNAVMALGGKVTGPGLQPLIQSAAPLNTP